MNKGTLIYLGGFILPDKNAAAQRVVGVAKALKEIGYSIIFLNRNPEIEEKDKWIEKDYFGFQCFETGIDTSVKGKIDYLSNIDYVKSFVDNNVVGIIAYNYPALPLIKLKMYCKKRGIYCLGDITEWYGVKGKSLLYKIIKTIDTTIRMRVVNKSLDGLIVISDYLETYYMGELPVVNIPPLVDKSDSKWKVKKVPHAGLVFVYAGSPSVEKERLDIIYEAIKTLSKDFDVKLLIIGLTWEEFKKLYNLDIEYENSEFALFLGRIPHNDVITIVSNADYSILIRDNNLVNSAGFPTKFVESISCGTPVISNENSCISKYYNGNKNGVLVSDDNLLYD